MQASVTGKKIDHGVHLTVRVPRELGEAFSSFCSLHCLNKSHVLRSLVEAYLKQNKKGATGAPSDSA